MSNWMRSAEWNHHHSHRKPERLPVRRLSGFVLARSGLLAALRAVLALGLAWIGGGLRAWAAPEAVFVVNSTADAVDFNPGDGVCETASGNGICTLRAAVMEANALSGADTITLPAGTYLLSLVGMDDTAAAGDLDILQSLTINGAGSDVTIIDANGAVTSDRAFHIPDFNGTFTLSGVTVQNGQALQGGAIMNFGGSLVISASEFTNNQAVSSTSEMASGGAIHTHGAMTISGSTFTQNQATSTTADARGGAVYVSNQAPVSFTSVDFIENLVKGSTNHYGVGGAIYGFHSITLDSCFFYANQALSFDGSSTFRGQGGAIGFSANTRTLQMVDTYFQENIAQGDGGGLLLNSGTLFARTSNFTANQGTNGGGIYLGSPTQTVLEQNTLNGNLAKTGGGVYSLGKLTIQGGTLTVNQAATSGGGIFNSGALTISGASITNNQVNDPSISSESGGGIYSMGSQPVTIHQTALEHNSAAFGGGISHDGVYTMTVSQSSLRLNQANNGAGIVHTGPLLVRQSTFSGNAAQFDGGALFVNNTTSHLINSTISSNNAKRHGGGIYSNVGQLFLANTTITQNTADSDVTVDGDGGGLYDSAGTVTLSNTVIANNNDATSATNQPEDCYSFNMISAGYNLLGNNQNCVGLVHGVNGDKVGTNATPINAMLASLGNNGGPTRTHLPLAGSPLIDAGNPAGCLDFQGLWLIFDQRGYLRPVDGDANASAICDIGATEYLAVLAKLLYLPLLLAP